MKVLIISHTCFSTGNNMGKTLLSYFRGFAPEELAQLYFHREAPAEQACGRYYRFSDEDALRSILSPGNAGRAFGPEAVGKQEEKTENPPIWYRWGSRRTAVVHGLRELLWKCSRWDTRRLWQWIEAFGPEVIFYAAGDYGFSYEIASHIAKTLEVPLAVCCVDDFYVHNRNSGRLGSLLHCRFLKQVHRVMAQAAAVFVICESLKREYEVLFGKNCHVLHTPAVPFQGTTEKSNRIVYLGNLELNRQNSLIQIGRVLQTLTLPGVPRYLDVYSGDQAPCFQRVMIPENGIRFHRAVPGDRVQEIMASALAVIHTEAFEPKMEDIVRHSVSAKIPDALQNGGCLIAYGPEGIASMDYLKKTGGAFCITAPEALKTKLAEILSDEKLRQETVARARQVARKNHDPYAGSALLRQVLEEVRRQ